MLLSKTVLRHSIAFILLTLFLRETVGAAYAQRLTDIDASSAIILAYQRIGEDYLPEESLRTEQFKAQIQEIIEGGYHVLDLNTILDALETGAPLPPRTLAITFDGAYQSIMNDAVPLLLKHKLPFAIFYTNASIGVENSTFMTWDELQDLSARTQVTLGVLPSESKSLPDMKEEEQQSQMNKAKIAYREHFGHEPLFFSYPFGKYNQNSKALVKNQGYRAAFGMHSGAAFLGSDLFALPRFVMTEQNSDLQNFRTITTSLPLPVSNIEPETTETATASPIIGFTLHKEIQQFSNQLSCFTNEDQQLKIETLGHERVEIRLKSALAPDQNIKINCTLPVSATDTDNQEKAIHWRWFGMLLAYHPVQ